MSGTENHSFIRQIFIEYLLRAVHRGCSREPVRHDSHVEVDAHFIKWPKGNEREPGPLSASKISIS